MTQIRTSLEQISNRLMKSLEEYSKLTSIHKNELDKTKHKETTLNIWNMGVLKNYIITGEADVFDVEVNSTFLFHSTKSEPQLTEFVTFYLKLKKPIDWVSESDFGKYTFNGIRFVTNSKKYPNYAKYKVGDLFQFESKYLLQPYSAFQFSKDHQPSNSKYGWCDIAINLYDQSYEKFIHQLIQVEKELKHLESNKGCFNFFNAK